MGEAKRRGTREQRVQQAIERQAARLAEEQRWMDAQYKRPVRPLRPAVVALLAMAMQQNQPAAPAGGESR